MPLDPYEELGVGRNATAKEIKHAYRRRLRQVHPDRNPDDPHADAKTRQATEAYDLLSDPARRDAYDRDGTTQKPKDYTAQAEALLGDALAGLIVRNSSIRFVEALRAVAEDLVDESLRQVEVLAAANLRLRALRRRFKFSGDAERDVLGLKLDSMVEANSRAIESQNEQQKVAERALELLDQYADVDDRVDLLGRSVLAALTHGIVPP